MTELGCVMRGPQRVRRRRIREEAEGRRKADEGREEQSGYSRASRVVQIATWESSNSKMEYHIISFTAKASLASEGSREAWR